jgi:hypothetical protein
MRRAGTADLISCQHHHSPSQPKEKIGVSKGKNWCQTYTLDKLNIYCVKSVSLTRTIGYEIASLRAMTNPFFMKPSKRAC